jgi:hypothetical protein
LSLSMYRSSIYFVVAAFYKQFHAPFSIQSDFYTEYYEKYCKS